MKSKDELKEIDIKNRPCYYFDGIIKDVCIYFSGFSLDKKLYEKNSVSDIPHKTSTGLQSLRIRFDKINGFIRVSGDEFRHLVLFDYEFFDKTVTRLNIL